MTTEKNHHLSNALIQELIDLSIVHPEKIIDFFPSVRDKDDVRVLKCAVSGILFLNRIDHLEKTYYENKSGTSYWNSKNRNSGLIETQEDDSRRLQQILPFISNKVYSDVGSGLGGILDLAKKHAAHIQAVEPQKEMREILTHLNYSTFDSIESLEKSAEKSDFISLFHVFEHIRNPLESLIKLKKCLSKGGKIFIEVPHANDALIQTFNLESFKKFTFWSEHLILHTRESLRIYLEAAGFKNIQVMGFQRYPLANHLFWLKNNEPGGHIKMHGWRNEELEKVYASHLNKIDQTDTIIAIAES